MTKVPAPNIRIPVLPRCQHTVVLAALFASGSAALIYEVCWIRQASLVFGSGTFAVSTVVAVFFVGLALGSALCGTLAHRIQRPVRLFAVLEILLGCFALGTPLLFQAADSLYGILYRSAPENQWLLGLARTGLVGMVILPATTVMGATLPLFCRRYGNASRTLGRGVGLLYGLNTLGAAFGAAAAGFLLIPGLGLSRTLQSGAAVSILAGLTVFWLPATRQPMATLPAAEGNIGTDTPPDDTRRRLALVLYFCVGFSGLALQVMWFRFLTLLIRNTVYSYSLVLTVVLTGIVAGSWLAAVLLRREVACWRLFGMCQMLTAISALTLVSLPASFWRLLESELWLCALLLLVPSILGGASFPLAVRLIVRHRSAAALGAGLGTAANTLGGVLGALLTGFLFLPFWGFRATSVFVTLVALLAGITAWLAANRSPRRGRAQIPAMACGLLWLGIVFTGPSRFPEDFLVEGNDLLLDHREGFGANLAAVQRGETVHLEIDRWWQGENRKNHQALSAHIPSLLHQNPRDVLLVGVGAGQTASRFLMHDIDRLDCVDIEPVIFDFVRRHFEATWMDDPRTRLLVEDGRTYLRHGSRQYDLISLELGQIFLPGVAYFYTREAYEFALRRLKPGGLLVQFVPLPFFTEDEFLAVAATFLEVFPQSVLWYNTSELLLIGANAPEFPWRSDLAPSPPWSPEVAHDLDLAHWGGPQEALNRAEVFLGGFLLGPAELASLPSPEKQLRDDLPVLDYATARVNPLRGTEIAIAERLRTQVTSLESEMGVEWDSSFRERVSRIQRHNIGDIAASTLLRQAVAAGEDGRNEISLQRLVEAHRWNPLNLDVNLRMGDHLYRSGRTARALEHFQAAVEIDPGEGRAHRGVAAALHQEGRTAEAIDHYRRAIDLLPEIAELHNNLGAALAEEGELETALVSFREAVRLQPDYREAQRNLEMAERVLRVFEE